MTMDRKACYAAVGIDTDGVTPVVWGIGSSAQAACKDAARCFRGRSDCGAWSMWGWAAVAIRPETACEILCGEMRCDALGISIQFGAKGRIQAATAPANVDLEEAATRWRAETGIVPYKMFYALPHPVRHRIAELTQTRARRRMAIESTVRLPHVVLIGD
jgi:hypothetical protein